MSRAERRRQERAARKTPVLVAGDGIIAAALGAQYEGRPSRDLDPKVSGRHRWVATGAWVIRDIDARRAMDVDHHTFLDNENLMFLGIGCWDCEQSATEIDPDSRCPA